jgi:microcystin-dependent protein
MEIIGDFVRLNTVTSNTEQVVVENAGTGPALKVTQTGVNSIAEFYDDGGVLALKIADGGHVGIGTSNPSAKLDVNGNIHLTGNIYKNGEVFNSSVGDSIPIGTIMPFYSATVSDPSYLICNGGTYNRVDYIELANVLGVSPTATTFQVPDLRDKFLKGKNADAVGATGGSATRTLVEANMPAHSHSGTTATNGAHTHNLKTEFGTNAVNVGAPNGQYNTVSYVNSYINTVSVVSNGDHAHTFTTDTKGSGTAFDILPPFTTVIYIIKAKNNQYVTPIRDGDYWTNVSNKLIYQSGNVGIGTNNPQQLLDVNGNIYVQGAIQSQSQFLGQASDSVTAPAFSWTGDTNVGIYRPSADTLGMVTNGVERMRVDANGNVGIGTANPLAKLHVNGNAIVNSLTGPGGNYLTISNGAGSGAITLRGNDITTAGGYVGIGITNPPTNFVISADSSLALTLYAGDYAQGQLYIVGGTDKNKRLAFLYDTTANTGYIQSMRAGIGPTPLVLNATGGSVGIGITNPTYPLEVARAIVSPNMYGVYMNYNGSGTWTGTWGVSGKFQEYVWATVGFVASSDARIKTNIQDIDDNAALSQLRLLKPRTYEYIDKVQRGSASVIGFIAQEVKEVLPRAVSNDKEIIPSIYELAMCINGTIQLEKPHGLIENDTIQLIQDNIGVIICKVKTVLSSTSFSVEHHVVHDGKVFVFGKEIDDFNKLDKNQIFTIGVAATQELDREVQQLKSYISTLEQRILALENRN